MDKPTKPGKKLNQLFATAICGNDILSTTFYVSGISILFAGIYAPLILAIIALVLYFYKSIYREVVEAIPVNGGAYNCLLNASSKDIAAFAGTLAILSYIATAVLSAKTATEYISSITNVPIIPVTIAILLLFAILVISGIKDSARVALIIFVAHIIILTLFLILGVIHSLHGNPHLLSNLQHTQEITINSSGLLAALFFGFAASLLSVSGFEASADFVEKQKHRVFRKTLRNMLLGVVIFNPLVTLIVLNIMPYPDIVKSADFLLSDAAQIMGGTIFKDIIVIDAFLILSGAVLASYIGVSGLVYRMTTDGCFPNILAKLNKKGTTPYIITTFFLLCTSILLITKGDLLSLAGVYAISFLSVMGLFALGNLLMKKTRPTLERTFRAPVPFVLLAVAFTIAGLIGNIILDPQNFYYFLYYLIPTLAIVYASLNLDIIYIYLLRISKPNSPLHNWLQKHFNDIINGKYIVFIHNIGRLHEILQYINRNEIGRNIYIVHCNNNNNKQYEKSFKLLKDSLPYLKNAGVFKQFNLFPIYLNEPFGPDAINKISKELKIRKNRILIGSIHHDHPFKYENLGNVRIIF